MATIIELSQTIFYLTGSTIAVLTYMKAKNGLLNTVNTEYHKKVIERLYFISEDLYSEFDPSSENYWLKSDIAGEICAGINEQFIKSRHLIVSGKIKSDLFGIPSPSEYNKIRNKAGKIRSDPFIPEEIRNTIIEYLDGRANSLFSAFYSIGQEYAKSLCEDKYTDTLSENKYWIHNKINNFMYSKGYGISDCESHVNKIRLQIQGYYRKYDPGHSIKVGFCGNLDAIASKFKR